MGDAGYRGVSASSDPRYKNKETKTLKQLEAKKAFPANFASKVDLRKCNLVVMRPWIEQRVNELLGFDDDVVAEYVLGILESEENQPHPDPRKLQVSLTGFLESLTPTFTAELWTLLLSAQESIGGIPKEFVEKKKEEMRLARERDARAIRGARQGHSSLPSRPPVGANFRDRQGNVTQRSRDAGWGPRSDGRAPICPNDNDDGRHRRAPRYLSDRERSRLGDGDRNDHATRQEEDYNRFSRRRDDGDDRSKRRRAAHSPSPPPRLAQKVHRDVLQDERRMRRRRYHSRSPIRSRSRSPRRSRSPTRSHSRSPRHTRCLLSSLLP